METSYFATDPTAIRLSVSAVVWSEGPGSALLLMRRSDNGDWGLPGGYVEIGESVAQAAAREVLEETGVRVEVGRLVGVYSDPSRQVIEYPDGRRVHAVNLCFEARPLGQGERPARPKRRSRPATSRRRRCRRRSFRSTRSASRTPSAATARRGSVSLAKELPMNARPKKFIFVTGGVLSGLGKGLSAAAIGALLEARGLRVTFLKLDPYLNVDPGTMNPMQHGEVYVTDDGAETDLDLGHYERFTRIAHEPA